MKQIKQTRTQKMSKNVMILKMRVKDVPEAESEESFGDDKLMILRKINDPFLDIVDITYSSNIEPKRRNVI